MNSIFFYISILILFLGIISLIYTTNNSIIQTEQNIPNYMPSKVFKKMFNLPSIWMGYTDRNSKNLLLNQESE